MTDKIRGEALEEGRVQLRNGRAVRLRRAESEDMEAFTLYVEGLSASSRDFMHGWSSIQDAHEKAVQLAAATESEDHFAIVATVSEPPERIVGYCWLDRATGPDIPMLGIGIVDEYHGQGLGRVLLTRMIRQAARFDFARIMLGVWTDNARGMHLYEAVGFHDDPEYPPREFEGRVERYMVAGTGR